MSSGGKMYTDSNQILSPVRYVVAFPVKPFFWEAVLFSWGGIIVTWLTQTSSISKNLTSRAMILI